MIFRGIGLPRRGINQTYNLWYLNIARSFGGKKAPPGIAPMTTNDKAA